VSGQLQAPVILPPRSNRGTHWIIGWVCHRASMDGCGEKKTSCFYQDSITGLSSS